MTDEQIEERTACLSNAFVRAMAGAIAAAGSQKKLSEQTGIHQSRISDYANGNYDFANLNVGTLIRLFPDLVLVYSKDTPQSDNVLEMIEQRMLYLFRRLKPSDKMLCYENMAKAYGESFDETMSRKMEEDTKR